MWKIVKLVAWVLTIVGALNWGFIGLFDYDLVDVLFGAGMPMVATLFYILIGISGVISLGLLVHCCKCKCCSQEKK